MEVQAYIRIDKDGQGELQFGLVHGNMDCEFGDESGQPFVEFTWSGNDEMDPAEGRGFAVLKKNDRLKGRIYFHRGDKSAFTDNSLIHQRQQFASGSPRSRERFVAAR